MGMGMGMIGAIGGVGAALNNESAFLAKQDDANADQARKKDYQGWLLAQQEQYQIRADTRADTRAEASKDRDFARTQREAPVRNDLEAAKDKTLARAKSEVAAETADRDAGVAAKLAEGKETQAVKAEKAADANYKNANAEYVRDAKPGKGDKADKGDPALMAELKTEGETLRNARKAWDEAVLKGEVAQAIDPQTKQPMVDGQGRPVLGTPAQREAMRQLQVREQRYRDMVQQATRGGASGAAERADPLGLKGKGGGAAGGAPAKAQSGMVGAFDGSPDDVAGAIAAIKDPQERANAEAALHEQMRATGGNLGQRSVKATLDVATRPPAAPRPGAQAAAPAALTPQQELDALDPAQVAQVDDLGNRAAAERRPVQMPDALAPVADKIRNLRAKIAAQSQAEAAQRRKAEQDRQSASQQQLRDRFAGGYGRSN